MFRSAYRIATVWGIPIKVHVSLLILPAAFALASLSGGLGAILMLLGLWTSLFTSIVLHELGHSLVATRMRCHVREITLMIFGGAAQMETMPRRPRDESLMALTGPAVSFVLAATCWFIGGLLPFRYSTDWPLPFPLERRIHCNFVQFVGVMNATLGVFNLLPAFPMDGGRVLRAALSPRLGRLRATSVASRLGKVFALLFAVRGAFDLPAGIIFIGLGMFIYYAADREYRAVRFQETLQWPGFGPGMPFFGAPPPPPPPEIQDQVIISPPPYERGPRQRSELRRDRDSDLP